MFSFKAFVLFVLICINTSSSVPEQAGSGSAIQIDNSTNGSVAAYPATVPVQVLKKLLDISDKSKGLFSLWKYSNYLKNDELLKANYTNLVCSGAIFHNASNYTVCQNATTCLKWLQLVNYYNELIIHLRTAENLANARISKEIQKRYRTEVDTRQRKVIELLRQNILPLMDVVVNVTEDEMDCNTTATIVNRILLYSQYCASIKAANTLLSQTTRQLYQMLINLYRMNNTKDHSSKDNDTIIINDDYKTKMWCIIVTF